MCWVESTYDDADCANRSRQGKHLTDLSMAKERSNDVAPVGARAPNGLPVPIQCPNSGSDGFPVPIHAPMHDGLPVPIHFTKQWLACPNSCLSQFMP